MKNLPLHQNKQHNKLEPGSGRNKWSATIEFSWTVFFCHLLWTLVNDVTVPRFELDNVCTMMVHSKLKIIDIWDHLVLQVSKAHRAKTSCGSELSNRPFWTGMASDTRVLKDLRSAHSHFRARPKLSLHSLPNLWNLLIFKLNTLWCHAGNTFANSKVEQGSSKFCLREKVVG